MILLVLPEIPVKNTGGGILLRELIEFLSQKNELSVLVPVKDHLEGVYTDSKEGFSKNIKWHKLEPKQNIKSKLSLLKRVLSPLPTEVFNFATIHNSRLLEEIRKESKPALEIYISSWAAAPCQNQTLPLNSFLYMVNVDDEIITPRNNSILRQIEAKLEILKVRRLMKKVVKSAGVVKAITQTCSDKISLFTDSSFLAPLMSPKVIDRSNIQTNLVLITTNFTYSHNKHSLRWFLSEVWTRVPLESELWITGRDNSSKELQGLVSKYKNVIYKGCLPDKEFNECYEKASLVVNPTLTGSGFQIKLLDAISRNVPVVSTTFSNPFKKDILSSNEPTELASLIKSSMSEGLTFDYQSFYEKVSQEWDNVIQKKI